MNHQNESGIILIITLWVIVILASISMSYIREAQLEAKMVAFQRDVTVADSIAKAGLQQALVLLREDKIKDSGEDISEHNTRFLDNDNFMYDGGAESWANNEELYVDVPFYVVGDKAGYYYVEVEDEASKFPINNMSASIEMIAHLIELSGVPEKDSTFLAAAIVDWRDQDDIPATLGGGDGGMGSDVGFSGGGGGGGGGGGDEYSTYNDSRGKGRRGQNSIPEIAMKNAPLTSIDELLLIPGMTPDIVYGTVDPNENQSGRFRKRHLSKGEYLGLMNLMTVYENSINLNTVKAEVLESLLYPVMGQDAEKIAQDWVEYRDGRDGQTYSEDDQDLKTIDNSDMDDIHFTEVNGFTEDVLKALQPFNPNSLVSNVFVVTSMAEYQGIEKGYRAVVERQFIPWDQMPIFGIDTMSLEDLEQVKMQVRLYEPIYDVGTKIDRMS